MKIRTLLVFGFENLLKSLSIKNKILRLKVHEFDQINVEIHTRNKHFIVDCNISEFTYQN